MVLQRPIVVYRMPLPPGRDGACRRPARAGAGFQPACVWSLSGWFCIEVVLTGVPDDVLTEKGVLCAVTTKNFHRSVNPLVPCARSCRPLHRGGRQHQAYPQARKVRSRPAQPLLLAGSRVGDQH